MTFFWWVLALIAQGMLIDRAFVKSDDPWSSGEDRMGAGIKGIALMFLFAMVDATIMIYQLSHR